MLSPRDDAPSHPFGIPCGREPRGRNRFGPLTDSGHDQYGCSQLCRSCLPHNLGSLRSPPIARQGEYLTPRRAPPFYYPQKCRPRRADAEAVRPLRLPVLSLSFLVVFGLCYLYQNLNAPLEFWITVLIVQEITMQHHVSCRGRHCSCFTLSAICGF
jgi:hypothetical protein